jgi:two-component system chemotaxis response regulator CheY
MPSVTDSAQLRSLSALMVDDSAITRKMIMKDLKGSGLADFSFVEADDGVDALEKYTPGEVDILFVDMQMPRMDGIEFLKELHAQHSDRPVAVMITSESSKEQVERAITEGRVDAFLLKPVDTERLQRGLQKIIDSIPDRNGPSAVPHGDVVPRAFREMIQATANLALTPVAPDEQVRQGQIIFGSISILGQLQWTVVLGFQRDAAVALATRFAGFEIPADSPDMGDAISEVVNITAGQIKRELYAKGIEVEISLPVVNAAENIRTLAQRSTTCDHAHFDSEIGKMWSAVTVGMTPGLVL